MEGQKVPVPLCLENTYKKHKAIIMKQTIEVYTLNLRKQRGRKNLSFSIFFRFVLDFMRRFYYNICCIYIDNIESTAEVY